MAVVLKNSVLWAALTAWAVAQVLKTPIEYLSTQTWDWSLLFRAGGMPSSHSALISATAHAIGLFYGFDSPLFGLAVATAMIVIYDATGIRREAGRHAELINMIIKDLREGHPLRRRTQERLKEMLGHTPIEALVGTLLGIGIAQIFWTLHQRL